MASPTAITAIFPQARLCASPGRAGGQRLSSAAPEKPLPALVWLVWFVAHSARARREPLNTSIERRTIYHLDTAIGRGSSSFRFATGELKLVSRNGYDRALFRQPFEKLRAAGLPAVVLDGEIAMPDERGVTHIDRLAEAMRLRATSRLFRL